MGYGLTDWGRLALPAQALLTLAALLALAGCGVLPQAVGATSRAAFAPMNTLAYQGRQGLQIMDRSVSTVSQTAQVMSRDVSRTAGFATNQINRATTDVRYLTRPVRALRPVTPPQTELTSAQRAALEKNQKLQKEAMEKSKNMEQPDLVMLPEQTLEKLTIDQKGLQNAAQKVALTASVGEVIFWNDEGRSGEVAVEYEHKLGGTTCRSFEQAVTIDEKVEEANGIACRDDETGRWALAF